MRSLLFALSLLAALPVAAGSRYLTWVDDHVRVHSTFVDTGFAEQQRRAQRRAEQSAQARLGEGGAWPGSAPSSGEAKRRYFTWIDGSGQLHNGFYAGEQVAGLAGVIGCWPVASRWGTTSTRSCWRAVASPATATTVAITPGSMSRGGCATRRKPPASVIPAAADKAPRRAIARAGRSSSSATSRRCRCSTASRPRPQALLAGSQAHGEGLYGELVARCCGQLRGGDFTPLSADEPRFEELERFSPSFDFPMGRSYYVALKLPASRQAYGLRVRSFANRQLVYPSLLFLDEAKRPARLVSDAVYQLHPETWYRYAFIEGTVKVRAERGERYVLLLTTDDDRGLQTLDNKPFQRPLQALATDTAGMQRRVHADEGAFELAIVR